MAVCPVRFAAADEAEFGQASGETQQYYEVRTYLLGENGDEQALDDYLSTALLPALKRQGIGPVGVFSPAASDENQRVSVVVVLPYSNANAASESSQKLSSDKDYLAAAETYLSRSPKAAPYQRISSELLLAMKCMPTLNVPSGTLANSERVYELRVYESPNEKLGDLKVHMFNNGEVPIFLSSGIEPIFLGQAVIGPQTPNLTYLTMYPSEAAREQAWKTFRSHPDWQVLKNVKKYQGTVSKIDKFVLQAKPYSEM